MLGSIVLEHFHLAKLKLYLLNNNCLFTLSLTFWGFIMNIKKSKPNGKRTLWLGFLLVFIDAVLQFVKNLHWPPSYFCSCLRVTFHVICPYLAIGLIFSHCFIGVLHIMRNMVLLHVYFSHFISNFSCL